MIPKSMKVVKFMLKASRPLSQGTNAAFDYDPGNNLEIWKAKKVSVLGDRASGNVHAAPSLDPRDPGEYRRPSLALVYRRQRTETLCD